MEVSMKKVIALIFILGLILTPLAGIAANKDAPPRVEIKMPKHGDAIKVYMFYDTTAEILCYVTGHGRSLQCWQLSELNPEVQQKIREMILVYKKQNDGNLPGALIVPGK